jgi:hypothetical protein
MMSEVGCVMKAVVQSYSRTVVQDDSQYAEWKAIISLGVSKRYGVVESGE